MRCIWKKGISVLFRQREKEIDNMKKIASVLLVMVMAASMAACVPVKEF